jgi:hypothetical protein
MTTCEEIRSYEADTVLSPEQAESWLTHLASCVACTSHLDDRPALALSLIEHSQPGDHVPDECEDPQEEIAPLHDEMLSLGTVAARRLSDDLRAQLDTPRNIEPLRYELRHAAGIETTSPAAIRVAVAISEVSHALESLVLQDEEHIRKFVLWDNSFYLDEERAPPEYFIERMASTVGIRREVAGEILSVLVELLKEEVLSIPGFAALSRDGLVVLVHEDDSEEVILVADKQVSEKPSPKAALILATANGLVLRRAAA